MTSGSGERRQNPLCSREIDCRWRRRISRGNFGGDRPTTSPRRLRRPQPETSTCGHKSERLESGDASFAARSASRRESACRLPLRQARKGKAGNQELKARAAAAPVTPGAMRHCCDISRSNELCARLLGSEPIPSRVCGSLGEVPPAWLRETTKKTEAKSAKTQLDTQAAAGCRSRAWSPGLFVVPRVNESGGP
jgi:hypothetical protein